MPVSVDWEGLAEFQAAVNAMLLDLKSTGIPAALQIGAQSVQRQAQQVCPVRTGFLRSSIAVRNATQTDIEIAAEADYAGFVEFGTSRMTARRYMEQGLLSGTPDFIAALGEQMGSIFR